jgi:hypothetical protein
VLTSSRCRGQALDDHRSSGGQPAGQARRPKGRSSGGVAGRLDGVLGPPGVQAALERLSLEAELAKLQRRTGAGLLPRSSAVQDKGLVAEAVGRPLGNLVGQDPDAAGDTDPVAVVLGAAADI